MPYYIIQIFLPDGKAVKGVKENENNNIDIVYRQFLYEAEKHYGKGRIKNFECFMISRQSKIYKEWMKIRQIKKGMIDSYEAFEITNFFQSKFATASNLSRKKEVLKGTQQNWGETVAKTIVAVEVGINKKA